MKIKLLPIYAHASGRIFLLGLLLLASSVMGSEVNQTIRIGFTGEKIIPAFRQIESVTQMRFSYNREDIDQDKRVSIPSRERTITELLDELSDQTALSFKIVDKDVIAISRADPGMSEVPVINTPPVAVRGRVTDDAGVALPGATIKVKGTAKGVSTDMNGMFSVTAEPNSILLVSFTGYISKEIPVSSGTFLTVHLSPDTKQLGEVVVTALGVKKERKALGYSVTQVEGASLTQARENNMINSLVGKVAGLDVGATSGGTGSASYVLIRGISSLGQTSQPLYVINGIPMENKPVGINNKNPNGNSGSQWDNAPDMGDAIGNINPDDIESISVLKGAAASALYGYRAKAGVILITTKSGKGNEIEYNSNYVGEQAMDRTNWQYVYGQGANNRKPADAKEAATSGGSSWGAKLDGSDVVQFDGVSRPYAAQRNNIENFYRSGGSWTNTLALNRTFDGGTVRFSASALDNNSVVPNSGLNRQNFNLSGNFNPSKRLTVEAKANYILEQANNRPMLSDGAGNANFNVTFLPTSINVNDLKPGTTADGAELVYNEGNVYNTNPWFAAYNFVNNTNRNRFLGSASLRYTFDNGLFLQVRGGQDYYTDVYKNVVPSGTAYYAAGKIAEQNTRFSDINTDVLIGKSFKAAEDLTATLNAGASYRKTESDQTTNNGTDYAIPFVYNISNATNKSVTRGVSNMETQSLYGSLEVAYRSMLFITGTARTDWFSTLATPGKDNKLSTFYPSVSGSFVFSEVWKPGFLNFGKLRAGIAWVGQATDPYYTQLAYIIRSEALNGQPLGNISNPAIPNSSLKASSASEFEIGTELRLLNRFTVDLTWYTKRSWDEIVKVILSSTTGYEGAILNSGKIQNKGFEALVSADILKSKDFKWTTSVNTSYNDNNLQSLASGTRSQPFATSRSGVGFISHILNMPMLQVMAYDYQYDGNGQIVRGSNGVPERGLLQPFGSAINNWAAGWNNEFSYKNIRFSALIDGKWGGKIFSATDYYGYINGLHQATLENREGTWGTGTTVIDAATYYSNYANNVSKEFVEDASFIKFRQLTLGYAFPDRLFKNRIKGLTLSLVGRNLFILMKKTENIDPESSYNATFPGLELGGLPPVRSMGLNLSVKL